MSGWSLISTSCSSLIFPLLSKSPCIILQACDHPRAGGQQCPPAMHLQWGEDLGTPFGLPGGLGRHLASNMKVEIRKDSIMETVSLVEMDGVHFRLGETVIMPTRRVDVDVCVCTCVFVCVMHHNHFFRVAGGVQMFSLPLSLHPSLFLSLFPLSFVPLFPLPLALSLAEQTVLVFSENRIIYESETA